jgi:hypothetical protein
MRITEELPEWKSSSSGLENPRLLAVGIHCADHATPSIRKVALASGGRSVGIVRLWAKAMEFSFLVLVSKLLY